MKITIKATQLDLTPSIKTYIEEKIGSLGRLLVPFEREGECIAEMEIGRTTHHHHKGEIFRAEVNLHLPGRSLRAEHAAVDMRVAIDRVRSMMRFEITKYRAAHLMRRVFRRTK